jgi:nitrite reductase (NO-forming)
MPRRNIDISETIYVFAMLWRVKMANTVPATRKSIPTWPKDALRIGFGIIWLIDAVLKWLPGFRSGYMGMLMSQAQDQPGWLKPWFNFWINLQHPRAIFFAYFVAVLETLIAVAVILGFARKLTYISAIAFSLLIWATAEGFGGPYTSGSSDIGTAVIYAVLFAGLLALMAYTGPARYSVDYYLEQKLSWWWKVAEVGHSVQQQPAPVVPVAVAPVVPVAVAPVVFVAAAANGTARPTAEPAGKR